MENEPSSEAASRLSPRDGAPPRRGTIAYIAHYFPALTQTFVYREVRALEELGWDVRCFSIRRPRPGDEPSSEARAMAERTTYLLPCRWGQLLVRLPLLFLARPLRSLRLLLSMLLEPGESARSRLHALTHFVGGICLVPEVRRSGARHFHAHFAKNPATIALVVSEYLGIPFSMTVHATDLFVTGTLLGLKLRRAKFVASISEYNRKLLEKLAETPADREKVKILHCGIDLERFPPRGSPPPGSARAPLVVAVGRLVEKKGYPYLLEAARILKGRGVEFELRLIGGGPDEAALRRQLAELDVGDRVRLDGAMPQEALLPILSRADVFVLPCVRAADGDQDGIPVSLMEAMAYEIACVSTTVSGVPELITSGTEGLLVPEKDPGALAAALERLLRDRDLRRELGRAGRRKVEREFSLAGLARALDALYRESVSARA